jgi:hypothetical protein
MHRPAKIRRARVWLALGFGVALHLATVAVAAAATGGGDWPRRMLDI